MDLARACRGNVRLGAVLCVALALTTNAPMAAEHAAQHKAYTVMLGIEKDGRVFINCIGGYSDLETVRHILKEIKQSHPDALPGFTPLDGAPADVVARYRNLVVSEGWQFGKPGGFC